MADAMPIDNGSSSTTKEPPPSLQDEDAQYQALALHDSSSTISPPTIKLPFSGAFTLPSTSISSYVSEPLDQDMNSGSESDMSSSPSSDISDLSVTSTVPETEQPLRPPEFTLKMAETEAAEGVQFVMEDFPTDNQYLGDNLKANPVHVKCNDRIKTLEVLPNYVLRVESLKDGKVGLMPAWNVEDPFERLARVNMEYNEAAACPNEQAARNGEAPPPGAILMHVHSHCPPQNSQSRREFVKEERMQRAARRAAGVVEEDTLNDTPEAEPDEVSFKVVDRKSRTVKFTGTTRKVFFRYHIPVNFNKKEKRKWVEEEDMQFGFESGLSSSASSSEELLDDAWPWEEVWTETAEEIERTKAEVKAQQAAEAQAKRAAAEEAYAKSVADRPLSLGHHDLFGAHWGRPEIRLEAPSTPTPQSSPVAVTSVPLATPPSPGVPPLLPIPVASPARSRTPSPARSSPSSSFAPPVQSITVTTNKTLSISLPVLAPVASQPPPPRAGMVKESNVGSDPSRGRHHRFRTSGRLRGAFGRMFQQ